MAKIFSQCLLLLDYMTRSPQVFVRMLSLSSSKGIPYTTRSLYCQLLELFQKLSSWGRTIFPDPPHALLGQTSSTCIIYMQEKNFKYHHPQDNEMCPNACCCLQQFRHFHIWKKTYCTQYGSCESIKFCTWQWSGCRDICYMPIPQTTVWLRCHVSGLSIYTKPSEALAHSIQMYCVQLLY